MGLPVGIYILNSKLPFRTRPFLDFLSPFFFCIVSVMLSPIVISPLPMLHPFRYNEWRPVVCCPQLIGPFTERPCKSFFPGIHPQPRTDSNGMFLYVDLVLRQMSTEAVVSFGKVLVRPDNLADLLAVSLFADTI